MKALVVFKVGDTFDSIASRIGDFEHWIVRGLGAGTLPVRVCDPRSDESLPEPSEVAGAVVSGSHAMVTDEAGWSEALARWLRRAVQAQVPVLGICYGHQLLAHALGGEVGYHPQGMELGTVTVRRSSECVGDALFSALPDSFRAHVVHSQSVRRLPSGAVRLAGNDFEPHQAFRVGDRAWGVQFHPEFSVEAMAGYIENVEAGCHAPAMPADEAGALLARFSDFVHRTSGQAMLD